MVDDRAMLETVVNEYKAAVNEHTRKTPPEKAFQDQYASWDEFDYFPRQHFRAAIRQYEDRVDDLDAVVATALSQSLADEVEQMPNAGDTTVYFWYDPDLNSVIQTELIPFQYQGVTEDEDTAIAFMREYVGDHGVDPSRFELYEAQKILDGEQVDDRW